VAFAGRVLGAFLIWSKPTKDDPARDLENRFKDYLDGYFHSFDYYPVCTRHVFARNDAFALWSDFMKIAGDVAQASEYLVVAPERYMELGAISDEELEKRKRRAAEAALRRAIEQVKTR
jgi:hypothetical protein